MIAIKGWRLHKNALLITYGFLKVFPRTILTESLQFVIIGSRRPVSASPSVWWAAIRTRLDVRGYLVAVETRRLPIVCGVALYKQSILSASCINNLRWFPVAISPWLDTTPRASRMAALYFAALRHDEIILLPRRQRLVSICIRIDSADAGLE